MPDKSMLTQDAEILSEALANDIFKAYDAFLAFVKKYRGSSSTNIRAVLLGADMAENITETGGMLLPDDLKAKFTEAALEIVKEIVTFQGTDSPTEAELEKIRKYFISKGRPISIYEGELISKKLGKFTLQPMSLKLRAGEITSVVGENGNGKSTLLKIIAGELAIDSGTQYYPEFSSRALNWLKIKGQIAYIPQDLKGWPPFHSLRDYLHFTAGTKGILGKANIEVVDYIITRLGLKKYQNYPWEKLSGGYKLRFELARQLLWSPKLLIMDEPLAHLDIKSQRNFLTDLRNLTNSLKAPMSVILSSQNLYEIEKVSDNVIFLSQGVVTYTGRVADISKTTKTNSYLLNVACSVVDFKNALLPMVDGIKEIRSDREEIMLITSSDITTNDIIYQLINSNITINYFRNISNSTRIFFEYESNHK